MILVTLQFHNPPTYLDRIEYSDRGEALVAQELMSEIPSMFRGVLPEKNPSNTLRRVSTLLLNKPVGPWKIVLLVGDQTLFMLDFGVPQVGVEFEEVSAVPRVSRYARKPVI